MGGGRHEWRPYEWDGGVMDLDGRIYALTGSSSPTGGGAADAIHGVPTKAAVGRAPYNSLPDEARLVSTHGRIISETLNKAIRRVIPTRRRPTSGGRAGGRSSSTDGRPCGGARHPEW